MTDAARALAQADFLADRLNEELALARRQGRQDVLEEIQVEQRAFGLARDYLASPEPSENREAHVAAFAGLIANEIARWSFHPRYLKEWKA